MDNKSTLKPYVIKQVCDLEEEVSVVVSWMYENYSTFQSGSYFLNVHELKYTKRGIKSACTATDRNWQEASVCDCII